MESQCFRHTVKAVAVGGRAGRGNGFSVACFVTAVRSRWIGVFDGRKTVGLLVR